MIFAVIAYDGKEEGTLERRMSVRQQHLDNAHKMQEEGKLKYAVGLLNENGELIGSIMIADFPSREEMNKQWLNNEPYILNNVWDKVDIRPAAIPPHFQ